MTRAVHPFPARMASEIALDAISSARQPMTLLDPMCGSGTVLSHASNHGHTAIGFDLDPLAILMSRVATSTVKASRLFQIADDCVRAAKRSRAASPPWQDDETEPFARYWFASMQYTQLLRLSKQLNGLTCRPERDALQIALSRTIVTKHPQASLAADTAHSRPHRVSTTSEYDVYVGFLKSVQRLSTQLEQRSLRGKVTVKQADARRRSSYRESSIDLIITSPPYLNAIDYLRGHRLALIWLGHSLGPLRSIRRTSIGAEAGLENVAASDKAWSLISPLLDAIEHPDELPTAMISRYAHDMRLLSENIFLALKPGAKAIVVVADSNIRGQAVPTGRIVSRCLAVAGLVPFSLSTREIPTAMRYLPVTKAGPMLNARMKREHVIVVRKAA